MDQLVWPRVAAVLILCGVMLAAWKWIPVTSLAPGEIAALIEPHRRATALAALIGVGVPLTLARIINRALRRTRPAA